MTAPHALSAVDAKAVFYVLEATQRDATTLAWSCGKMAVTSTILRGSKMRSTPSLMDEVSAALQFPYYFGGNWAALDECLSDMEWLLPTVGFAFFILDAGSVLADERADQIAAFVRALNTAADEFSTPVETGESWDRPAVAFHVVLQAPASAEDVRSRWERAGASVRTLVA